MKKKISIALCLLLILISTTIFASTPVKMEIVENNICNIKLNENSKFEKKIVSSELDKNQVTLQLQVTNEETATQCTKSRVCQEPCGRT